VASFKKSVFSRSVELLNTARKIAGHEISQKIKESVTQKYEDFAPEKVKTRVEQAKILAESLSQLKGAAMKVGQLLSLDSSDILPKEVTEVLSQLQNKAEPVPFDSLEKIFVENIDAKLYNELKIDRTPYSAASIGQVHVAYYHGKKLALKVQYPGVRESIHSDLAILQKVGGVFLSVSGKKMDLGPLFKEFESVLIQETDYIRELNLMTQYRRHLQSADLSSFYAAPEPVPELSSESVLAMSFEEGLPLREWIDSQPTKEQKHNIAHLILDLYCREFFDWGLVQTDPNYGNFLVRDNKKLVLLDFGATVQYERSFVQDYCNVLIALDSRDDQKILDASIAFHLIDPRESDETKKKYISFMKLSLEPFSKNLQPFNFADKDYAARSLEVGRDFTSSLKYSAPPKHILLLHRKLGGIFNILRKMEITLDLIPYWEKMLHVKGPEQ
jgi:aarF domain-containing kinase